MGQGASFFAGLEAPPRAKPEKTAPVGQAALHFPQRMHSGALMSLVTSTCMGQAASHFQQPTHLCSSRRIWKKLKRLNRA